LPHFKVFAAELAKEKEKLASIYESDGDHLMLTSPASMERDPASQLGPRSNSAEQRDERSKLEPNSVQVSPNGHQISSQCLSARLEAAILARKLVTTHQDQDHGPRMREYLMSKCDQKESGHACEGVEDSKTTESTISRLITGLTNNDIWQQPQGDSTPREVTHVESRTEDFLELMFLENDDCVSSSDSSIVSHATSDTPSSSNISRRVSTDSPNTTLEGSSSREGKEIGHAEDSGYSNRGAKRPRLLLAKRSRMEAQQGRRLACPLHIFNQQKYCKNALTGKKYETCSGPGWSNMHYLKYASPTLIL
jgi:hypothetical protein